MKPIDKKEDNKEMDDFPHLVLIKQDVAKNHIGNPILGTLISIICRQISQSKNN